MQREQKTSEHTTRPATRREFLGTSALAMGSALAAVDVPAVHAAGSGIVKVGLIGCGGRGTGAAVNAARAGDDIRIWALGDVFADRLQACRQRLRDELGDKVQVSDERCFLGFEAYKQVTNAVDVVLLATPPHFRPAHIRYAVETGRHIFAEKPMAVDAPGVRSVLESAEKARAKKLTLVSGFCFRYDDGMRETIQRIHDGAIGDIVALHTSYNTGMLWVRRRQPDWGDLEWQLRNWLYFTWLSGDHIVEQHVHSLDKAAWVMRNRYPIQAVGMGGRQTRTGPEYGHIFDHHAVVFDYDDQVRVFSFCRQQPNVHNDVSDHVFGTNGSANLMQYVLRDRKGKVVWSYPREKRRRGDMYQNEINEMFDSIRAGAAKNDGDWMARSTLMAIMGRMATYTGQLITWEKALHSQENLTPPVYDLKASLPVPPVARPGETPFV